MIKLLKSIFRTAPKENEIAAKIEIKEMPAKSLWS
ncbi:hypothetical protein tinsulaeT_08800 [Thalassotalea insulae]|uniref:Uncharacterized protein n=1 Tax=Thalassotalea insulae TaxID=2056778 RepID=A0ABQ6GS79_9GAMM|nr:hypothetical protein tinsulaeT_08800 [Thalassotalea insulae]